MRKNLPAILGAVLVVVICAAASYVYFSSPQDGWVCQDGQWKAQGNPTSVKPSTTCTNGDKAGFEKISGAETATKAEELTADEKAQWERIVGFIRDCGVKDIKQNYKREVTITLKNTLKQQGKEPALDDIIKVAQESEAKCGQVSMVTE